MPDVPPPGAVEDAAVDRAAALTPEQIEAVLSEFRTWLQQIADCGLRIAESPDQSAIRNPQSTMGTVDLHTLVAQFTALRHEVNLQTKATRSQQEQTAEILAHADRGDGGDGAEPSDEEQLRPLLKGLVELYDALALARREMERVRRTDAGQIQLRCRHAGEPIPEIPSPKLSFWDRVLGRPPTVSPELTQWRQQLQARQEELCPRRSKLWSASAGSSRR